ncbi:hypothetical protein Pfo_028976 [Paulownia fortunei]|nr:hypothetical protein Pfo_028976 [Paulownia fortunei]
MMLVLSSIAYSVGIGFVTMSTPPVLANSTGTCKQYESQCIGHTQKVLFCTGMALLAVGIACHLVSLHPLLEEQEDRPDYNKAITNCLKLPGVSLVVIVPVVGAIALPHIKPWSLRFGIPAICNPSFFERLPPEADEDAKIAIGIVSIIFIVCGIVSSIGNTYFVEQANHMNRKIGKWKVPLQVLLLLLKWAKTLFDSLAVRLLNKSNNYAPPIGIAVAMMFSVLCCTTAARIEIRSLKFFLLAGLDSFFEYSVAAFYKYQSPKSMRKYLGYFTKGVSGLGFIYKNREALDEEVVDAGGGSALQSHGYDI